ncbi:lysophospholipid acyltransferase family protein [Lutibacter sp.]
MNFLTYILVYPLIWLISILPFRILYLVSDAVYILIYYIIGYRKKVVLDNLKLAFPNKTEKELLLIRKKFFKHFVDIFMEMIKSFTISTKEINRRYTFTNTALLDELYSNGKSAILVGAHYANWEWIMSLNSFVKYKGVAAYTKVNNPYFNRKILKTRERFGVILKQTPKILNLVKENQKKGILTMYGLLSDQSPHIAKTYYWSEFFGVKVPIHTGAEMLAKRYDLNLVFMKTRKIKRGFYETSFSVITTTPTKFPDYELTDIFLRKVEEQVYEQPEYYFWTHKRFKHKDKYPKS